MHFDDVWTVSVCVCVCVSVWVRKLLMTMMLVDMVG